MKPENVITLLKRAYASEIETVQNYLANSVWLDGLRAQEVVSALAADVTEELGHARRLAERLKQLGACPPGSLALTRNQTALQPSTDPTDLRHVVAGVLAAEREAVATYLDLIAEAGMADPVTADLAVNILADEERHRSLFEGFLKSLNETESRYFESGYAAGRVPVIEV